ncbi:MAG TPA: hypothetical protein VND64_36080, partial [Pirellulales bacterium]|nr:hypothetical protein [Pirellulales bacterium]
RAGRYVEPGIVTSGDDVDAIRGFFAPGARTYAAADVIAALLEGGAAEANEPNPAFPFWALSLSPPIAGSVNVYAGVSASQALRRPNPDG